MTDDTRSGGDLASLIKRLDADYQSVPNFERFASCHVDVDVRTRKLEMLERRRARAEPWLRERAIRRLLRSAALDTGALEGLYEIDRNVTLTVAVEAAGWREELEQRGSAALRFFEAQLSAFDWLIGEADPLSEKTICELHEHICEPQDTYEVVTARGKSQLPLPKGRYKTLPNHVVRADGSTLAYAPVYRTEAEMRAFINATRAPTFEQVHTVIRAAYVHYGFIRIHPFADGNGRVARALSSAIFMARFGVPLVMFFDERDDYFAALAAADEGAYQPFVDFVFDRAMETLSALSDELRPEAEVVTARLQARLKSHGGLPHLELDALADSLLTLFTNELKASLSAIPKPTGVAINAGEGSGGLEETAFPTFRYPSNLRWTSISVQMSTPVHIYDELRFVVLIAKDTKSRYPFVISSVDGSERHEVLLHDMQQSTAALRIGLKAWARGVVSARLMAFEGAVQEALQKAGFHSEPS